MEVLTFGESMIVFSPQNSGPLRYVHSFDRSIGGADSNVAIALSRLGYESAWFSKLGDDEFGRYIRNTIRGEGVDVSKVKFTKDYSTGLLFKERFDGEDPNVYYYRKHSAASTLTIDDLDLNYIKKAKIIHITGITPALSKDTRDVVFKVLEVAKENGILISFDPNIRLKLWDLEKAKPVLLKIASMSDIIFPGIDEGKMLLESSDEKEIASKFIEMGAKIVAVKLGADGCFAADKNNNTYVKGYKIKSTVDTVGAGDGFAAGFLSGILRKLSLFECGKLGNALGAMATLVKGDMEGYPYLNQLEAFMGDKKTIDR
ncbi:sugar kinase [Clostridium oceanicum]|uniref:2-dehydro-3-deoxygluconokinase n=1 Tax=Clostridium oceanicum TaxID=1543 RepID=A0ABP3UUV9_9CLOT